MFTTGAECNSANQVTVKQFRAIPYKFIYIWATPYKESKTSALCEIYCKPITQHETSTGYIYHSHINLSKKKKDKRDKKAK